MSNQAFKAKAKDHPQSQGLGLQGIKANKDKHFGLKDQGLAPSSL